MGTRHAAVLRTEKRPKNERKMCQDDFTIPRNSSCHLFFLFFPLVLRLLMGPCALPALKEKVNCSSRRGVGVDKWTAMLRVVIRPQPAGIVDS